MTIDTMRWDRLGVLGYDVETPNLDRLAAAGTLFGNAVSVAPQTLPSHASILSGVYPSSHGVRNNGVFRLRDDVETMAEVLKAAGFATGGFVGAFVLDRRFGLTQGFDRYDDDLPDEHPLHKIYFPERSAAEVVDRAVPWIREQAEAPFFAWIHVFDPHGPYLPPAPFDERYAARPYDGEIASTDRELGRVLELVSEMENSLIVVTADHGESLGEHGESTHGLYVYDATVRVPLLMRGKGVPAGLRVDAQVRTVDIAPTVLELAGLAFSGPIDGESLLAYFADGEVPARAAYAESFIPRFNFNWSELRSLRTRSRKFILAPRPELYDLVADPGEGRNQWSESPPAEGRRLASELAELVSMDRELAPTVALDEEAARRLESLGYVGTLASSSFDERERPDPKDRIEVYERMQELLSPDLSPQEAIVGYHRILEAEPTNALARNRLANTLSEEGRLEEAVAEYRRLVLDSEIDFKGLENLSAALLLLRRTDEALTVTELAVAEAPWNPDFLTLRGEALEGAGRLREARLSYEAAVELERAPENYWRRGVVSEKLGEIGIAERDFRQALSTDGGFEPARTALARLLTRAGRAGEALVLLDASPAGRDRGSASMKTAYAEVHLAAGQFEEAETLLEEARRADPDNSRILALLGPVYGRDGRLAQASAVLEQALSLGEKAPEIRRNLALVYLRQGKLEAATDQLRAAIETDPDDPELWYSLGNAYTQSRRSGSAVEAFRRALELRPRWPEAAFNLGVAADGAGRTAEAVEAFRLYLEASDPSDQKRRDEVERRLDRLSSGS